MKTVPLLVLGLVPPLSAAGGGCTSLFNRKDLTGYMGARRIAPGTIALQGHDPGSMVYYKNIRIKQLD